GEQVLERIAAEQPDILITDINMPYLNGVELLQLVQKKYPALITFVISGYDDFSFVKDSFLAGSINYLMKPVGKIDLVNALSRALEIIAERQSKQELEKMQQIELQKASSFIKDQEFSQLLDRKMVSKLSTLAKNNHMDYVSACLILVKIHDLQDFIQIYSQDMNLLSMSVKKRLQEIEGDDRLLIFNYVYHANEFLIAGEMSGAKANRLAQQILKDFSAATKGAVTVIESEHCYCIENLYEAYVQDISCMMLRPFGKKGVAMKTDHEKEAQRRSIPGHINELHIRELQNCLKSRNLKGLKVLLFENIGLAHCEEQEWSYLEVRQTIQRFANLLMEEAAQKDAQVMLDMQSMQEIADKAVERMDFDGIKEVLTEMMEFVLNVAQTEATDSIRSGIRQAVLYVDEHFRENLTLVSVAERFHIEKSYFSRMFRKETGENFVLYISRKRMEKAVEYMKKTEINLTEIAFMVGYDDYTYFNKVFRKTMGVSPREYRNRVGEERLEHREK
ncbi:MAG: helix-turn-helix domain-containing protein, partial [Blautia sp.]|nr:helix-turn-helix domain-containing protein [Blautia sp.]